MEEDFAYAGILLEVQSGGMLLVAQPEAAGELWPGTPFGSVPDCTGTQVLDVVVSQVPPATVTHYGEEDFTEEQVQAFWALSNHVNPFGLKWKSFF